MSPGPRRPGPAEDLLELDTRRVIYEHVARSPGVHLRQIQRDLDIPLGTLEYHLRQLERRELVVTRELSRLKAYFTSDGLDRRDRDVLYFLRQEMPRRLVLLIVDSPGISFQGLCARVPVAPSTVSFHLRKLVAAGIVSEVQAGREKCFRPLDGPRVRRLVVQFHQSFVDSLVDRFADAWMDIGA